jgi:hypothetical protein
MKNLLRCIDCNLIYAETPVDQAAEYLSSESGNEYRSIEKNDRADFENRHRGHRLEKLFVLDPFLYSSGAYFDPSRITYLTASNTKETLLIKKWRERITEPLRYDVVQGRLQVKKTFKLQKIDLRKQFIHEIRDSVTREKASSFIRIVEEEVLRPAAAQEHHETVAGRNAQTDYQPLREKQIRRILNKCSAVFTRRECKEIECFIRNNCDHDGVMSLVVKKTARLFLKSNRPRAVKRIHYAHTTGISHQLHLK